MPRPSETARQFAELLDTKFGTGTEGVDRYGFAAMGGRYFDRIVRTETRWDSEAGMGKPHPMSVHAFVNRKNGDLLKAASWKSPQRDKRNTLCVRYTMQNRLEIEAVAEIADQHGAYLYKPSK